MRMYISEALQPEQKRRSRKGGGGAYNRTWLSFLRKATILPIIIRVISIPHRSQQFILLKSKSFIHHPLTKALECPD
jgi:hypothetical protein